MLKVESLILDLVDRSAYAALFIKNKPSNTNTIVRMNDRNNYHSNLTPQKDSKLIQYHDQITQN